MVQVAELAGGAGGVLGVSRHPGGPAVTTSRDAGATFPGAMRVLTELPTPSCQTSLLNAGCGAARPACTADRLLISAPWSHATRTNMTLSAGSAAGGWAAVVQLSHTAAAAAGYSALAQTSDGRVLCMWEGPCGGAGPCDGGGEGPCGGAFCLATVDIKL